MRKDELYRAIEKIRGYEEGEVIAVKIWTKEDIEDVLQEEFGIENPTQEMIDSVANNKGIKHLEDCYDEEWETIRLCCEDAGIKKVDVVYHVLFVDEEENISTEDIFYDRDEAIEFAKKLYADKVQGSEDRYVLIDAYDPDDTMYENPVEEIEIGAVPIGEIQ